MLDVQQLTKSYTYRGQTTEAVAGVSFALSPGRILGLLGPNGAGKSSTIRMLATVARPTSGVAMVAGYDIGKDARRVRANIGYVPQSGTLLSESVVGEELIFHGQSFGISAKAARERGEELLTLMGAESFVNKRAGKLSGGERRKVDIAMGMMNRPAVAFLDEPTVGLDPDARQDLWDLITKLRQRWNTTVVLTTHYLDEAENLADEIILLKDGRIIAHDTTDKLQDRFAIDRVSIRLSGRSFEAKQIEAIDEVDQVSVDSPDHEDTTVQLSIRNGKTALPKVLSTLSAQRATITELDVHKGGLNDTFFSLTGSELDT